MFFIRRIQIIGLFDLIFCVCVPFIPIRQLIAVQTFCKSGPVPLKYSHDLMLLHEKQEMIRLTFNQFITGSDWVNFQVHLIHDDIMTYLVYHYYEGFDSPMLSYLCTGMDETDCKY